VVQELTGKPRAFGLELQTEAKYFRGGGQMETNADLGILGAVVKLLADWKMRKPKRRESGAHPMYCIYFSCTIFVFVSAIYGSQ
jgi:hypothetical protein